MRGHKVADLYVLFRHSAVGMALVCWPLWKGRIKIAQQQCHESPSKCSWVCPLTLFLPAGSAPAPCDSGCPTLQASMHYKSSTHSAWKTCMFVAVNRACESNGYGRQNLGRTRARLWCLQLCCSATTAALCIKNHASWLEVTNSVSIP